MAFFNIFTKGKKEQKDEIHYIKHVILDSVERERNLPEGKRREAATELLDTYYGFGLPYVKGKIKDSFKSIITRDAMLNLAVALPLMNKFMRTISMVYDINPTRKFILDGKVIVAEEVGDLVDPDKYKVDEKLYETLTNLYNPNVTVALKGAEPLTNMLDATVYKVNTDVNGKIKLVFIPNDNVQVCEDIDDITVASSIGYIKDSFDGFNSSKYKTKREAWSKDFKSIPSEDFNGEPEESENKAGAEAEKLFKNKEIGWAFAPFVVFRNAMPTTSFWDNKGADLKDYLSSINVSLTEKRYLTRYTTFGLKYTVNLEDPADAIADPTGIINYAISGSKVPNSDTGKDWAIGEFANNGKIKEMIESIIFDLKMAYDIFDINLDSLITTNSVRSAESKLQDNENLFAWVNSQREIWNLNEQNLFKVMQAVHNRDNTNKIPKGIEVQVNFTELNTSIKTQEEWLVEIQNNISSYIDWLADLNPDLDRDELARLLADNRGVNDMKRSETEQPDVSVSEEEVDVVEEEGVV